MTSLASNGTDLRSIIRYFAPSVVSFLLSVGVHASVAAPYFIVFRPDPESMGEDVPEHDESLGDGQIGDGRPPQSASTELLMPIAPVAVSLYTSPPPEPEPEPAPEPEAAEPAPEPEPAPAPVRQPRDNNTSSAPNARPNGQGDPDSDAAEPGDPDNSGVAGKPQAGGREPCEEVPEVTQINATKWKVNRDLIDYYATHLRQLDKQAGTSTAHGKDAVPIGVRVYLPRCSVLRKVGLRNKDIILSINDRPVATLPQAIKTWLALRNERDFTVVIRRKGVGQVTHTYRVVH